jgi:hypothetical protein
MGLSPDYMQIYNHQIKRATVHHLRTNICLLQVRSYVKDPQWCMMAPALPELSQVCLSDHLISYVADTSFLLHVHQPFTHSLFSDWILHLLRKVFSSGRKYLPIIHQTKD